MGSLAGRVGGCLGAPEQHQEVWGPLVAECLARPLHLPSSKAVGFLEPVGLEGLDFFRHHQVSAYVNL